MRKKVKKEEKRTKRKRRIKNFVPFEGEGFIVTNINVESLYVKKDVKISLNN